MEVEPKRRRAVGGADHKRRRIRRVERTGAVAPPRPDAGQGKQVGEIERVDQGTPQVGEPVAGVGAEPGLQGVDGFDTTAKAQCLDDPAQLPCPVVKRLRGFMQKHDAGSEIARADVPGLHLHQGFLGIFGHELGVAVGPGAGVVEKLVEEPEHLLLPGLAVNRDFPGRVELIQADEPGGETIWQLQPIKVGQHGRPALLGQPVDTENGNVLCPDARGQAADQIFPAKKRVQVHGRSRHAEGLLLAGQALLEMGKER